MSVKQIRIITPGGDLSAHVPLESGTTAAQVLEQVGLSSDFVLSTADGKAFFQPGDTLDPVVKDGATLYANPWAQVGLNASAVRVITAAAILAIALSVIWLILSVVIEIISKRRRPVAYGPISPGAGPVASLPPFWQQVGWRRSGDRYAGLYNVGTYSLPGEITFSSRWDCHFKVHAPDRLIAACAIHRRCFIPARKPHLRGWRWYQIHFTRRPRDVSSGIVAVQQMLGWGAWRLQGGAA